MKKTGRVQRDRNRRTEGPLAVAERLRGRVSLMPQRSWRLHGWVLGIVSLVIMWLVSFAQQRAGVGSLAVRNILTFAAGYLVFLTLARWWAGVLARRDSCQDTEGPLSQVCDASEKRASTEFRSGNGGEYAGGGADASFDVPHARQVLQGAKELLDGALTDGDDKSTTTVTVVVACVALILAAACAGAMLSVLFGAEILLSISVEAAVGAAAGARANRGANGRWLRTSVRLTWLPWLAAACCSAGLGIVVDVYMPDAKSLGHAFLLLIRQ